ncbi:hypothetical protein KFL_006260010 [Klebsormidium nitens]|uniref:Vasohibin n=1 Tax=Klebsormidium nitens TaxID=105231 RepID=A0A1Y1IHH0_KLENI|nr:hypothetical protein KFL_006260010 [Klebsormidium nitens]|eukprot:GAQ90315.1 hypothetical protein KFL_006260010 [Klebsormidium nitens]
MGCSIKSEPSESEPSGVGPAPPRPVLPEGLAKLPLRQRLRAIQQFISSFEYNYTPETYFNVRKKRPLKRIVDTGRQIIRDALPIKCVEAVFLALLLTSGLDIDRIPLGFKTAVDGQEFRHIVLVVRNGGRYGALGISRRKELMFKDLVFNSLAAIVTDFKQSYERWWHTVLKIRVGLPVEHDAHSQNQICWRYLLLKVSSRPWEECCTALDLHASCASKLWDKWVVSQAKLAQSSKQETSASSLRKGRVSPDSEPDGSGCPVLSDGPVIRSAGKGSVLRRSKRSSHSGKRKGCGLLSVKSAPDLVEIGLAAESATESRSDKAAESLTETRSQTGDAKRGELPGVEMDSSKMILISESRTGSPIKDEESSESDSDAPSSPSAKVSY